MTDYNDEERRNFAQQLLDNPLFHTIFDELEKGAVDRGIGAAFTDHETRAVAMLEVRAIRNFRSNCQSMIDNNRPTKAAPA